MSVDKIVSVNNCIYLCHVVFICAYALQQMEVIKNIHTYIPSLLHIQPFVLGYIPSLLNIQSSPCI